MEDKLAFVIQNFVKGQSGSSITVTSDQVEKALGGLLFVIKRAVEILYTQGTDARNIRSATINVD